METSKEKMSEYLEKLHKLQRMYLGYGLFDVLSEILFDKSVVLHIQVGQWDYVCQKYYDFRVIDIKEWYDKEKNDEAFAVLVDHIENKLKWKAA